MVGKSSTGNRKKSKSSSDSNSTTLICSLEDYSVGSGFWGATSAEETVFGIDWLREEILKYVIYDNSDSISRKSVKNARVVQRIWLQTITKLIRKLEEPLIVLAVDVNGNAEDPTEKGDQPLDQLVERFGTCERLPESFLPVKLHFKLEFFRERNYKSLSDCLTHLGSSIVDVELEYPKTGGTMPSIFPLFKLPHLRKLSFEFSDKKLEKESDDNDDDFTDNRNGLWLLQTILNASENLQNFFIPFSESPVPLDFRYLRLSVRVSVLKLLLKFTNNDLESVLIRRNPLPNLKHLTLLLHQIPFEDNTLLFRILERFQKTLQALHLHGYRSNGHRGAHTLLQFPYMKKLTQIGIFSTECELAPGNTLALQKWLPGLKVAKLCYQTEARLVKWIKSSKFENVEDVFVSLVNDRLRRGHERYFVSPSFEIMTQLYQACPYLSSMTISFNISDLSGLKSLFQNMVLLQVLEIQFFGNEAVLDNSCDLIDSILLGLPLRLVVALKEDTDLLETMEFKGGKQPSITNLSELGTLFLWTEKELNANPEEIISSSLISNLLFRHAFLKMTKLWNLILTRKFKPSSEMQEEWDRRGRSMTYHD